MAQLHLLPGLGADARLFASLGELCLPIRSACLPAPAAHESMTAYALRVATQIDVRPDDWIGGSSLGALVAAEIARHRPVSGLILIGGALTSETVMPLAKRLAPLARFLPLRPFRALISTRAGLTLLFGPHTDSQQRLLVEMLAATPDAMLRAGAHLATSHFPKFPPRCPVHAIHGSIDSLMRPPLSDCRLVPNAGHALALTHAHEVTTFLRATLCQ
jgi:pimeloyl-ACP methyl ester carboxylesterase